MTVPEGTVEYVAAISGVTPSERKGKQFTSLIRSDLLY